MRKFIAVILTLCLLCGAAQAGFQEMFGGILAFLPDSDESDSIVYEGTVYRAGFCQNAALRSAEFLGEALFEDENCNSWHFLKNDRFSIIFRWEGTLNALPVGTFFCAEDDWESALAYYNDILNWSYHISFGRGIYFGEDYNPEYRAVPAIHAEKFIQITDFSDEKAYDPFGLIPRSDLIRIPLSNPDEIPAIHFCRISSDGAMEISSRTFHYIDNRLLLLYRYDYGQGEDVELICTETPPELNDYFVKLLENC